MPSSEQKLSWDLYAWALIGLCSFFQLMQWPLSPRFLDIYYHLGVMKGFSDAGGYVSRAFWEYAPSGRPHLYPPALHLLMLFLYKIGMRAIDVGRFVDCLSYPALLLTFHLILRKVYPGRLAFLALLFFSSAYSALLASVTLSAFNLAFIFGLLAFWQFGKKRWLSSSVWLIACFYSHTLAAWLFVLSILAASFLKKDHLRTAFKTVVFAVVFSSPLLAHQYVHRSYFQFVPVHENRRWETDPMIFLLAFAALWRGPWKGKKEVLWMPLALSLGFSPLIFTHQTRYFSGHGMIWFSVLAAIAANDLLLYQERKKQPARVFGTLLLLVSFTLFLAPVLRWDMRSHRMEWRWAERSLTPYLFPQEGRDLRSNSFSIYFEKEYEAIAREIRAHSAADDILWTDFSYTAGILGILSDRATSCAMLAEIKPYDLRADRLKDAKIIVWFKDKDLKPAPEMGRAVLRYHLLLLKETDMAFVYQNPEAVSKRVVPKAIVPIGVRVRQRL